MSTAGYFLTHLYLIPLFPLISAAIMLFVGRRLPNRIVSLICVGSVFLSFVHAAGAVWNLLSFPAEHRVFQTILFEWITPGLMPANGALRPFIAHWGYLLDPLTCVMILVVTGVGFLIHVYSIGYMGHEGGYYRFFGYLNLFMFSMLTLVLANNLLLMFVGWEGVGLCSYLLIGFYFLRKSASDAGKKAFIVNRVGDTGFLLGIFLISTTFGTIRYTSEGLADAAAFPGILQVLSGLVHHSVLAAGAPVLTAIALLLFVGATGKSAQIPLYVWLPDAMEGPTPVSALIHAATMVTAGVYMVARMNAIYQLAPVAMDTVAIVGATHGNFCGIDGAGAVRHQESAGLFDDQPIGLHVSGAGSRRVFGGNFPPDDPRVLQGAVVPRGGQRDSRAFWRAGHPQDGRSMEFDPSDGEDIFYCDAGDFRDAAVFRILQQG